MMPLALAAGARMMRAATRRQALGLIGAALLTSLVAVRSAIAQSGPSLVILVRHAEKAAVPGDDPPLSELGQQRARDLATALVSSPPNAIVVSSRQRTALTATPVATAVGVAPTVVSLDGGGAAHIAAVAAAVRKASGVVLVVGHSNTVPAVIKALGGPALPDICDATYSQLYVLRPTNDGKTATLVVARYGANESAPPASCAGPAPK